MIAIGVTATPVFVRLTRGQTLAAKVEDYVEAARAVGNPHWRIALRHVLPNIVPPLLVQASLAIAGAIIAEAALSFLGLGQQPPAPSLGQHAEHRAALHRPGAVDGVLAGLRDLLRRAVVQPAGRRPARRARPRGTNRLHGGPIVGSTRWVPSGAIWTTTLASSRAASRSASSIPARRACSAAGSGAGGGSRSARK